MKQFLRHIFLLVALFAATTNAWAGKVRLELQSSPSNGGYVYANSKNENKIGTLTSDYAESGYKVGVSNSALNTSVSVTGYNKTGNNETLYFPHPNI